MFSQKNNKCVFFNSKPGVLTTASSKTEFMNDFDTN